MKSILYLVATGLKNRLKEVLRSPGKLVLYLLVLALVVGMAVLSMVQKMPEGGLAPLYWLQAGLFAYILLFLIIGIVKGLSSGDTFFSMSDVNLLFVSPVSPRVILLYGIARLTMISFWAGFFILFQASSLGRAFGIRYGALLLLLLAFILGMVFAEILCLTIYIVTNGSPRRKMAVRLIAVAAALPYAAYLAVQFAAAGNFGAAVQSAMGSPLFALMPGAGWAAMGAMAVIEGRVLQGIGWFALTIAGSAALTVFITRYKADYYEDVLSATETAFEKRRAAEEGAIPETGTGKKVKVAKTGLWGFGARALFGKHIREALRESRLGVLSMQSLIIIAGAIAMSFFLKNAGGVLTILQMLMWMQIFFIGMGKGMRELSKHYIFLIPASSFSKLVWSNMETVLKTLIESTLIFGVSGAIMRQNPLVIVGAALAYTLFSLMLLGINLLFMRWTGASISSGLLVLIYFVVVLAVAAPGVVGALIVGFMLGGDVGAMAGLGILAGWELLAALVCFALSKGVLHSCDMETVGQGKR